MGLKWLLFPIALLLGYETRDLYKIVSKSQIEAVAPHRFLSSYDYIVLYREKIFVLIK